jgi:hypothetical protein
VKKHIRTGALYTLALLFNTVALVGCGGGPSLPVEGAPVPRPAPAPGTGTGTDTAFASPSSATDTVEAGKVQDYAFAERAPQQTLGTPQFADGAVTLSATLSAAQVFAGVALRAYAPNNTGAAPVAPFDASAHTQLKIQLKSSTDALLQVKLHPSPLMADGCTATANVMVNSTLAEVVIDLDDNSFPLPDYCNGAGSKVGTVKAGLYAVDVINPAVGAGAHDLSIGTVKLAR